MAGGLRTACLMLEASEALRVLAVALCGCALALGLLVTSSGSALLPRLALVILVAPLTPHPTRTRILEHLRLLPGDHLRSIARTLRVSLGEVRYHLHILHRSGLVHEEKVRHRARYYAADPASLAERNRLYQKHWEQRDVRTRVLHTVQLNGAVRPTQVAKTMGISRQLANYHLGHLTASGQLARENGHYRLPQGGATSRGAGGFENFPPRPGP
jgi:DNA-binding transcriptional ArsR family regulator